MEQLSAELICLGYEVRVFGQLDIEWETGDARNWRGAPASLFAVFGPRNFGFAPKLAVALAEYEPDIVHVHGIWNYISKLSGAWARKTGKLLVVSPHGMLNGHAWTYSRWKKIVAFAAFQRKALESAALIVATSQDEAEAVRRTCSDSKIRVIPNGVRPPDHSITRALARSRRIVSIGRLHPIKGLEILMEAWARVQSVGMAWSLVIAGPGEPSYRRQLLSLARKLGLVRFQLLGELNQTAKTELLGTSCVFAIASRSENFALTVPEALIAGVPVISSKGAPWSELERQGCGWWIEGDVDSFESALLRAMEMDMAELESMGRIGERWARSEFSWQSIATRMSDAYQGLLPDPEDSRPVLLR